jgi:hypothetical protein
VNPEKGEIMKTPRVVLLALLLLGSVAGIAHAQVSADIQIGPGGGATVDVGYFYDNLSSYGNWIERPSYGWVWTPRTVAATWQPYQSGHWVATDQGWTWVTDEPYGWATYHYGRWYDDPEIGWSWVPGNEWAPSWVSWQEGSNYIGWAPLPPSVTIASGFNGLVSVSLAPAAYVFVQERDFLAPSLGSYYVPRDRVDVIYRETRNTTNYNYSGGRVYNTGVAVDRIQAAVGRPVPRYKLADLKTRGSARVQGNQVEVFRPQVHQANVPPPSARPVAKKAVVDAAQFQKSHPERAAARRAVAQGAAPAAAAAQAKPARPAKTNPAAARAGRNQVQTETPPARQRKTAPQPPVQTEQTQAEKPRPAQAKRQRQPAPPEEQQQQRVQSPQQHQQQEKRQQPPPQQEKRQQPPPQQEKHQPSPPQQNQQRQQRPPEKEKPQQDEHKPPQG